MSESQHKEDKDDELVDPAEVRWQIDRRVPLALIVAIAVQTASFAFWIGGLSTRVEANESAIAVLAASQTQLVSIQTNVARVDASMASIDRRLERIEDHNRR